MIIDCHTHIFPPTVRDNRGPLIKADPAFRLLYNSAKAKLVGASELIDQMDRPPHYATRRWRPGELVLDTYTVAFPERPVAGTYQLLTGFYDDTVTRLPVVCDGIEQPNGLLVLSSFEVP